MSVDTRCKCGTYFSTGNGRAKMCQPCYIARVAELEGALRTWKNMMANPNYDLGEIASGFDAIVREVLP